MTDWPDLAALELFVAVADGGSLAAGARAVGMAQPNASRSMARLQRHLGMTLLHRSTTGSTLTAEGLIVLEWARRTVAAAMQLREGAAALVHQDAGDLGVSASQTIAEYLLPRWLSGFHRTHPQVRVAVRMRNTDGVLEDLHAGRSELGFVEGPRAPAGVHSVVIADDDLILVTAPDHPWARRTRPIDVADLRTTPLVTREPGSGTREAIESALGPLAPPALELPSNASVRLAVAGNAAPAVLSALAAAEAIARGDLVRISTSGFDGRRSLRAVWTGPRRPVGHTADLLALTRD